MNPTINNALISSFDAEILSFTVGPCDYSNGFVLPVGTMIPVKLKPRLGLRSIALTMDFSGDTEKEITDNIIAFTKLLHEGAELSMPDEYIYKVYWKSSTSPIEKAPWIKQVKFALTGYRHGELISTTISASSSRTVVVNADGDYPTPVVMTIATQASSVSVFGVAISNIGGVIVVDGYKKTVTQGGVNKFGDTTMNEFPSLSPGDNSVTIINTSGKQVTVVLSYYPLYR